MNTCLNKCVDFHIISREGWDEEGREGEKLRGGGKGVRERREGERREEREREGGLTSCTVNLVQRWMNSHSYNNLLLSLLHSALA